MCTMLSWMCCCRTPLYTMQCQAASNAYYSVLSSLQLALLSFSCSIHCICTILQQYLSNLYSIVIYLSYWITIFDFLYSKNFKISQLSQCISIWDEIKPIGKLKISFIMWAYLTKILRLGSRLDNSHLPIKQHMGRVLKVGKAKILVIRALILYLQQICWVSCKLHFPLFLLNLSILSKEKTLVCMNIVLTLLMIVHYFLEGKFIYWMKIN